MRGSTALLLALLGGCGGRTTFQPDDPPLSIEPAVAGASSRGSDGSAGTTSGVGKPTTPVAPAGGSGSGGARNFGGSGGTRPSTGVGGFGGSAGRPDGLVQNIAIECSDYCDAAAQAPCPSWVQGPDCLRQCDEELGPRCWVCQRAGANVLSCLLVAFVNSDNCADIERIVETRCAGLPETYQSCVDPKPTPKPTPSSCASSGSLDNGNNCTLNVKCDTGAYYQASCFATKPFESSCSCVARSPDGSSTSVDFSLNEQGALACEDTLAACGFPTSGLK
ncbi:MAG TPA: hypothetical protein VFK05_10490 [Polyangiaceae bacterium]|nr:hypothetical protein [Polyangiaceae bacterium]